jgi:long-chain fatty acid transport protein
MKKLGIVFLIAMIGFSAAAFGAGLSIPEQGAAALGLSAAMTARSQDLSSIFYNPAGITYVEKNELFVGITPIHPSHTFDGAKVSLDSKSQTFVPPQAYFAHRLNSRTVIGAGIYSPFGLGTNWGTTWEGRYTSTYAKVQTVYFTPTIAWQAKDWLSIGAGYSWVYSNAVIEKMVDSGLVNYGSFKNPATIASTNYDSKFHLDGTGGGVNWNLGVLVKASPSMQVGLSYRGPTNIKYTGKAKFIHQDFRSRNTKSDSLFATGLDASMPYSQDGETTLHLPASVNAGVLYKFTDKLDASFDFNYSRWQTYDKLVIKLSKNAPAPQIVQDKSWNNSTTFRLGTSYAFDAMNVLRGGVLYDKTPVPDETFDAQLPDNDRYGFSLGYGHKVGIVSIDAGYMLLFFANRDKDNFVGYSDINKDGKVDATDQGMLNALYGAANGGSPYPVGTGTYKSRASLFSVSASVNF